MKKYRITGKSEQMRFVTLRNPVTGKFYDKKFRRGISFEVGEDELTFHVERQAGHKLLKLTEIEEVAPVVEEPVVEVEPEPEPEPEVVEAEEVLWPEPVTILEDDMSDDEPDMKPKKRRSRRKKSDE